MSTSTKPIVPTSRRRGGKDDDPTADWTAATEAPAEEEEPHKKLSLKIPESVHQEEKVGAAKRRNTMVAEVIELLKARNGLAPWPADVVESVQAQIAAQSAEKPATAAKSRTSRAKRGA
ncbi:hypothetical protein [Nocardia brasiliensis]|uniref:hypothetical protein n=1 Tax=Nocardia brasiliensis TaxID=37326 RepID=UPI0024540A71|nr:hypothetical protein [Nocardia brasiliensis]